MININIINAYNKQVLIHQLDKKRYEDKIHFAENSHEDIVWDYVVVFQNLNHEFDGMKYHKGGLIYIAGEPESMEPYCRRFFRQFNYAIVPHPHLKGKNIIHSNPALNWHYGRSFESAAFKYDYNALEKKGIDKTKNISMMCSNKRMMPGHILRYKFYQQLRKHFDGQIDFYGAGIQAVDDKADILNPYRFHICVENSTDEHYWTEKIADPILGFSIPIYYGAPNIFDYFPKASIIIIDINKPTEVVKVLNRILRDPQGEFEKRLPALLEARDLLLNKYNMFPMLERFIDEHNPVLGEVCKIQITPYTEMREWKLRMAYARMKRLFFKLTH